MAQNAAHLVVSAGRRNIWHAALAPSPWGIGEASAGVVLIVLRRPVNGISTPGVTSAFDGVHKILYRHR